MSTYTFTFTPDDIGKSSGTPGVTVTFDDTEHPFIEDLLSAFEQFLLGVTYQPGSIRKYLDVDAIHERMAMARAVADLKDKHGVK